MASYHKAALSTPPAKSFITEPFTTQGVTAEKGFIIGILTQDFQDGRLATWRVAVELKGEVVGTSVSLDVGNIFSKRNTRALRKLAEKLQKLL